MDDWSFYRGRRVLITGHTGFKGAWLCRMLTNAGAEVTGYSLAPPTDPSLFDLAHLSEEIRHIVGDVRDFDSLLQAFRAARPEIVFHLAAQPIVRTGYSEPRMTYETNVMGTVNLLECVRRMAEEGEGPRSVLNVTTDKVYRNDERGEGYREEDALNGFDPYSNSKSCSELVTQTYVRCFFQGLGAPAVSTARAGNVIGGGDFAKDRILPDCLRAVQRGEPIRLRNPNSVRPYQHVLEPLAAYLMIALRQYEDTSVAGSYNVGPEPEDCVTTAALAEMFCRNWGEGAAWVSLPQTDAPHEAALLRLDCAKLKSVFGWAPRWNIAKTMEMTCRFGKTLLSGGDIRGEMDSEIQEFMQVGQNRQNR